MGVRAALVLLACTWCGLTQAWFSSGSGGSLFDNRNSLLGSRDFGSSRLAGQSGSLGSSGLFGQGFNFFNKQNGYNGFNQEAANQAGQQRAGGLRAEKATGARDDFLRDNARSLVDRAVQHGFHSGADAGHALNQAAKQAAFHNVGGKKKTFNRAKVLDDGVDYEFDKKFNKRTRERGGYEEENEENRKKSDQLLDKEKNHKLSQSDLAAAKAQADAQKALKGSEFSEAAAKKEAGSANYGQAEKTLSRAGEKSEDQEVDYTRKDSKHKETDNGLEKALRKANEQAGKNADYDKLSAADAAAQKSLKDGKFAGVGTDGKGGGDGVKGAGGQFHSQSGENAKQLDQGKENAAKKAALDAAGLNEYNREKNKVSFDEVKGLKSNVKDKLKEDKHEDSKQGYSSKDNAVAKTASGADKNYAAAAAQSSAKAAKSNRTEDLLDREQILKKQQEDLNKSRKFKKFFHDKDEGGDNYEKLKYKRNRVEKEHGDEEEKEIHGGNSFANANSKSKHANFDTRLNDGALNRVADIRQADRGHKSQGATAHQDGANYDKANNYAAAARSGQQAHKAEQEQKQDERQAKRLHDNSYASAQQAQRAADNNIQNQVDAQLGNPGTSFYSDSVLGAPSAGYYGSGIGNVGGYGNYGGAGNQGYGGYGNGGYVNPGGYVVGGGGRQTGGYLNKGGYANVAYQPSNPQVYGSYQQGFGGLGSGFQSRPSAFGSSYGLSESPRLYGQSPLGAGLNPAGSLSSGIFNRMKSRLGTGARAW